MRTLGGWGQQCYYSLAMEDPTYTLLAAASIIITYYYLYIYIRRLTNIYYDITALNYRQICIIILFIVEDFSFHVYILQYTRIPK